MNIQKQREAFERFKAEQIGIDYETLKKDLDDCEKRFLNNRYAGWDFKSDWELWQAAQAVPEGFVLVPKDKIYHFYQDNDEPENLCNSPSGFDGLGDCIDLGDVMQINKHTLANIGIEKLYGTWVADAGNPLERSRSKFFVGTESECGEIVLENERVFEEAQEQSHD